MSADPSDWPRYCNAILRDPSGRYLLELRSIHETEVPGQITCFGGGRQPGEHPDDCIRRELAEELGVSTIMLDLCVVLRSRRDGAAISWFYRGAAPDPAVIRPEPGVVVVRHSWDELAALPVGGWNRAALAAERRGLDFAEAD